MLNGWHQFISISAGFTKKKIMVFRCSVYEKHLISTGLTSESSLKIMASLWDQFQLLQAKLPQTI